MSKQLKVYLVDILNAIEEIESFTKDLTYEEFAKDIMAVRAVTMDFAIIGEAAKQIPAETKRKYDQVPWKQMAGIRDKVIHGYVYIKIGVLLDSVKLDLPALKPMIRSFWKNSAINRLDSLFCAFKWRKLAKNKGVLLLCRRVCEGKI